MSSGPEFTKVEQPLIDQLVSMGWRHITGSIDFPEVTGRETFGEVLLRSELEDALRRINRDPDGNEWLDDERISKAISAIDRITAPRLMEANQEATELLLSGTVVHGLPDWDQGRDQKVHYIDWQNPENNRFTAINQFRVDEPGGQAHEFIAPDLVLFVNGIPLVVVECKSPGVSDPVGTAIGQLHRYSNQRDWLEGSEGNERLFHYNQFMVATCFEEAVAGTIGARSVDFLQWKDTSPVPKERVAQDLGKASLSSQETLIAGMLRPAHLLDIVRHFTVFGHSGQRTIKMVARYQQFRAVHESIDRLRTGDTRLEDGEHDRRGGIIWHTQGSGKSLSMVFLVRKMRSLPDLRSFKVVFVTDRRDLQKQLSDTAHLSGEVVNVASSIDGLKKVLAQEGPDLIFAMIQKFQERDDDSADSASDDDELFPILNEDESIVLMVDEAHRSHTTALHANLMRALPNCAKIGFTGTPIIMGKKRRTHEIFGEFIDKYTITQSEDDGSTVPIFYEGRTAEGIVQDGREIDELFEDMFHDLPPERLDALKKKYATRGNVLEAPKLIERKARDMLRHYVETVLPNGFKAQVVAVSRRATIRYHEAFRKAQAELIEDVEARPELHGLTDDEIDTKPRPSQFVARAARHIDLIRELDFAPVISGDHNDPPEWAQWTRRTEVDNHIGRFKKPLRHDDPEKRDPLAFLIVKSMLLTGFDAPIEQVLYLDRHMKEHELLQAIARVNRTYPKKAAGLVVDYYGVARHLKEALAAYSEEDIEGALRSLKDELPKLRDQHARVVALFQEHGIAEIHTQEGQDACVDLLVEDKLRAQFQVGLKAFLTTLDLVLPRPEGLPYVRDAKNLSFIQARARMRYRGDEPPIGGEVGAKVRKLIDDHIIALGVDPKIPLISISDANFEQQVEKQRSPRAKASEMEHAVRYHIRKHFDEDPEHYEKLSERLERILDELKGQWDELVDALEDFVAEAREGRRGDETGLDPVTQAPFLGVLKREVAPDRSLTDEEKAQLVPATVELVEHVRSEVRRADFWRNPVAQSDLRKWIVRHLDDHDVRPYERLAEVADHMVDLARVNHERLTR